MCIIIIIILLWSSLKLILCSWNNIPKHCPDHEYFFTKFFKSVGDCSFVYKCISKADRERSYYHLLTRKPAIMIQSAHIYIYIYIYIEFIKIFRFCAAWISTGKAFQIFAPWNTRVLVPNVTCLSKNIQLKLIYV